ncbi:retinol dehydrogenase 8 [Moniliophthora roreri]|nr:retinol dehydrogenase 8 [Moniliophthora roreri]
MTRKGLARTIFVGAFGFRPSSLLTWTRSVYPHYLGYLRAPQDVNLSTCLANHRPEETSRQFNTNVFGALNVSRAFLPYMRECKTGTIVFMGSIVGWWYLGHSARRNRPSGPS